MSEEALSQAASGVIFDELVEASPGITFDGPEVQPFVFGKEGPRPAERLTGLERMGEKIARAIRPAIEPIARARVTVTNEPLALRTYQDWQDEQPEFSALTLYRLRPLKGGMQDRKSVV